MRRFPALILAALWLAAAPAAARAEVTVFAAASLKTALDAVADRFGAAGGGEVRISYAGSSALARQIESGAPAQIFVSANTAWMDHLQAAGLLAPGTRRDLLTNRLVLVAGPGGPEAARIGPDMDLAALLGDGRLATALVQAVPAGIYAREALTALGLWDMAAPRLAQSDNVRAALRLVALGEAPMGIVYATDAAADSRVRVLDTFDAALHGPIRYPVAMIEGSDMGEARAFYDFLTGAQAAGVFVAHGFGLAGAAP